MLKDNTPPDETFRLRVPGGWLYKTSTADDSSAVAFVPLAEVTGYKI